MSGKINVPHSILVNNRAVKKNGLKIWKRKCAIFKKAIIGVAKEWNIRQENK